jgi:uncharacterized membrane protein required for colicin V production
MTYQPTNIYNIVDIILLLAMVLLSLRALKANLLEEIFSTLSIVLAIFISSCFYSTLSKFIYNNISKSTSCFLNVLSIILLFVIIWQALSFVGRYILGFTGDAKPSGNKVATIAVILRFIKIFLITSILVYLYHDKMTLFQNSKVKYSRGAIYKTLRNTGKSIFNLSNPGRSYCH